MRLVNEAKSAILLTNKVVDTQTWSIKNKHFCGKKVTDYLKIFEYMEHSDSEKPYIVPFTVKSIEEPKTEEFLFINKNYEYVAFNAKYIQIFKDLNNIKDGFLFRRSYVPYNNNESKNNYGFLVNSEDCKFLLMGLKTVNPNIYPYLRQQG